MNNTVNSDIKKQALLNEIQTASIERLCELALGLYVEVQQAALTALKEKELTLEIAQTVFEALQGYDPQAISIAESIVSEGGEEEGKIFAQLLPEEEDALGREIFLKMAKLNSLYIYQGLKELFVSHPKNVCSILEFMNELVPNTTIFTFIKDQCKDLEQVSPVNLSLYWHHCKDADGFNKFAVDCVSHYVARDKIRLLLECFDELAIDDEGGFVSTGPFTYADLDVKIIPSFELTNTECIVVFNALSESVAAQQIALKRLVDIDRLDGDIISNVLKQKNKKYLIPIITQSQLQEKSPLLFINFVWTEIDSYLSRDLHQHSSTDEDVILLRKLFGHGYSSISIFRDDYKEHKTISLLEEYIADNSGYVMYGNKNHFHNTLAQDWAQYFDKQTNVGELTTDEIEKLEEILRNYLNCDDEVLPYAGAIGLQLLGKEFSADSMHYTADKYRLSLDMFSKVPLLIHSQEDFLASLQFLDRTLEFSKENMSPILVYLRTGGLRHDYDPKLQSWKSSPARTSGYSNIELNAFFNLIAAHRNEVEKAMEDYTEDMKKDMKDMEEYLEF